MKMKIQALRDAMHEKGYTQTEFAKALGMDASTLSRKLKNGGKGFTLGEIYRMVELLNLKEDDFADMLYPHKK